MVDYDFYIDVDALDIQDAMNEAKLEASNRYPKIMFKIVKVIEPEYNCEDDGFRFYIKIIKKPEIDLDELRNITPSLIPNTIEYHKTGDFYQREASKLFQDKDFKMLPIDQQRDAVLLGLISEGGEVLDVIKKAMFSNKPIDRDNLTLELGDVLYHLVNIATMYDIKLEDIESASLKKLSEKFPHRGIKTL